MVSVNRFYNYYKKDSLINTIFLFQVKNVIENIKINIEII